MEKFSLEVGKEHGSINVFACSFLDEVNKESSKESLIKTILEKSDDLKEIKHGGYPTKDKYHESLDWFVNLDSQKKKEDFGPSILKKSLNYVFEKCKSELDDYESFFVFEFPIKDKFVEENMGGVNGFSPAKNVIFLFVSQSFSKNSLNGVIAHELAHSISPFYHINMTIGNGMVFDGLAEHFKEQFVESDRSLWTTVLSYEGAKKIFFEIEEYLYVEDWDKYHEVFFGTGEYPWAAGYTIGYYIVGDYLKKTDEVDWKKFLKADPKKILNLCEFRK